MAVILGAEFDALVEFRCDVHGLVAEHGTGEMRASTRARLPAVGREIARRIAEADDADA